MILFSKLISKLTHFSSALSCVYRKLSARFLFPYLIADDAPNGRATDCSHCAAARQDGATDCTDTCAYGRVLVARGHPATPSQTEQHCCGKRTNYQCLYRFLFHVEILI
jgi:hypothetical protein